MSPLGLESVRCEFEPGLSIDRLTVSQYLVAGGIIPTLLNTAQVVWEIVASSIEGYGSTTDNEAIPCFDTAGKCIPSEIGPMNYSGK